MGLEDLELMELLHGSLSLLYVIISLIVGFRIFFKYFTYKRKELITVGLAWIFISSGWWGAAFSFLSYVLFDYLLELSLYLFFANAFLPLALICWIYSFCILNYPHLKNKIVPIFLAICLIFEIFLILFLLIDPEIVGTMEGTFDAKNSFFAQSFRVFAILTVLITSLIFVKNSLRAENVKTQWKGKFLLIANITFIIGAIFEVLIPMTPLLLIIVRSILITSSIAYYLGFLLPDRVANWLTKEDK